MHTDILYIIIEYIDDYWFMKHFSFLYKDKFIEKRRKYLIRINSAKLLYKSTKCFSSKETLQFIYYFINDSYFYTNTIKEYIEYILKDRFIENIDYSNKHKIFFKKYIISSTITVYDHILNKRNTDFLSGQNIVNNVKLCSIYRLSSLQKKMIKDCLTIKALIY